MEESALHNLLINDVNIQRALLQVINIEEDNFVFIHEDSYPNGLYADFTIKCNNIVKAIIECKGSNIGVNEYVRGIGQVMQYQHYADNNLSSRGYEYDNAFSVLLIPSSIVRNRQFNIGLFGYPNGCKIVELNETNNNIRLIAESELRVLSSAINNDLVTISQYYIRDNRLFELYLCLKYCQLQKVLGYSNVDRRIAERVFLMQLNTPNNRNWRNAFISLSSLGLIDINNIPTNVGARYSNIEYEEFAYEIYKSYINEYIDILMPILLEHCNPEGILSYNDIKNTIDNQFNGKKVMFLTESQNRYLSSFLNIMRDDFGCISFNSRNNLRAVNYNISSLNKNAILSEIRHRSNAYDYIRSYYNLIRTI